MINRDLGAKRSILEMVLEKKEFEHAKGVG